MMQDGTLYGMLVWTDRQRPLRRLGFVLHLLAYVSIIMVLPYATHSSWLSAWAAVTAHVSTSGLIFAFFSQINHINEASIQVTDDTNLSNTQNDLLKTSWAAQQVVTSNNFASNSTLWHFLSNGLNYQIEHHLFPGLNHCHLHHIAPVVKETCDEYGVAYKSYDTWKDIMQATLDWLDRLAVTEDTSASSSSAAAAVKVD